jgi:hypothetical protein
MYVSMSFNLTHVRQSTDIKTKELRPNASAMKKTQYRLSYLEARQAQDLSSTIPLSQVNGDKSAKSYSDIVQTVMIPVQYLARLLNIVSSSVTHSTEPPSTNPGNG